MADEFTVAFLRDAALEAYETAFKNFPIGAQQLVNFNTGVLEYLIAVADDRIKFTNKWKTTYGMSLPEQILEVSDAAVNIETGLINVITQLSESTQENYDPNILTPSKFVIQAALEQYVTKDKLLEILRAHPTGDSILFHYNRHGTLENGDAEEVAKEIIVELLKKDFNNWDNKHWEIASLNLAGPTGIFFGESPKTFYTAGGKGFPAGGKLPNTYRNTKQRIREKRGEVVSRKRKRAEVEVPDLSKQPEDVKYSIQRLESDRLPLNDLTYHWGVTSNFRLAEIKGGTERGVEWVFKKWSALQDAEHAGTLIKLDFAKGFKAKENALDELDILDSTFKKKPLGTKNLEILNLRKLADNKLVPKDLQILAKFRLLPYYLPSYTSMYASREDTQEEISQKVGGEQKICHRFSGADVEKSMVQFTKGPETIAAIKERIRKAHKNKPVQPYILVVKQGVEDSQTFFVIINDEMIEAKSAADGIDLLFKSFHVFDLQYPKASQHIWIFLEKGLYALEKERHIRSTLQTPLHHLKKAQERRQKG